MRKLAFVVGVVVLLIGLLVPSVAIADGPETKNYGDVTLSGGSQAGHFSEVWDLTACDLVLSFTYDANGLVDDAGAHAWAELGVRQVGYGDFNPTWMAEGAGVWLATDYDWAANTFDPDPAGAPTQDLDDKLILQKGGGVDESYYDLPSTPPNPWANHGIWFDRDGVDQWQAQMWGAIDGGTYNTGGTYDVVITLHVDTATSGTAYMTVNGEDQGFYVPNWHSGPPDLYPAGMTFTGDMTQMQVFYGLYGYGATHSVAFNDITVTGCVRDDEGPITSNVVATPNPVKIGESVTLTANVDDSTTGGLDIASAEYSLDDGATWFLMDASDGTFDAVSEDVEVTFAAPTTAGIYDLCVRGTDKYDNVGDAECIMLVVYDPEGGFVTGGGWIDSPAGAYHGPNNIAGTFTGDSTSRFTNIQCDPNNTPITFTGSVEVTGIQPNGAVMIGLIDQGLYDSGDSAWGSGAYLYLGRIGTNVRIGPSDGFMGGEINQVGANVPYVDGGPNLFNFSMTIHNGEITVTYDGTDYVDTYGEIEDANVYDAYPGNEFDSGAYVGLDSWPEENEIVYDINISGCPCGLIGKASFGFVSKYKKGANVPEGNTEFVFKAGDLNFHSTEYDWLVVTGSNYAKFKGTGTINGEGSYKFQLWAGDGDPDTFRIKIWEEDESGNETVIYDNGMDQAIGGGSIVVHTK